MIHLVSVLYWVIVTVFISRTKRQRQIFSHIQFLDVLHFITFPQLSIHSSKITKQYVNKYWYTFTDIHLQSGNPNPQIQMKTLLPDQSAILFYPRNYHLTLRTEFDSGFELVSMNGPYWSTRYKCNSAKEYPDTTWLWKACIYRNFKLFVHNLINIHDIIVPSVHNLSPTPLPQTEYKVTPMVR